MQEFSLCLHSDNSLSAQQSNWTGRLIFHQIITSAFSGWCVGNLMENITIIKRKGKQWLLERVLIHACKTHVTGTDRSAVEILTLSPPSRPTSPPLDGSRQPAESRQHSTSHEIILNVSKNSPQRYYKKTKKEEQISSCPAAAGCTPSP